MSDMPADAVVGDEFYRGFRITEVWAVTAVDPSDDSEGIVAIQGHEGPLPLVGSDRNRLTSLLEPMAREMREEGIPAEIKHFVLLDAGGLLQSMAPETVPEAELHADPEWREYVTHVEAELIPKIKESGMTISLVPEGKTDVKFAIELGLSIMFGKPILALVPKGAEVPEKLAKVADLVLEWDPSDPEVTDFVGKEIASFARDVEAGKYS